MQVLRTIGWVLLAVVLVVFAVYNGKPVEVQVWPTLIWEPPLAALAIFAFLLGLVPMWLVHRTVKWRLKRRVGRDHRAGEQRGEQHCSDDHAAEKGGVAQGTRQGRISLAGKR